MSNQSASNYINLQTAGIGYLGRVRKVSVKKGPPFVACSINAIHGENGVEGGYTYVPFDVKAVNEETEGLLNHFMADANNEKRVVKVCFRIGDYYLDSYQVTKGPNAGQTRTVLKGRLLLITHVWVKDKGAEGPMELAYERPKNVPAAEQSPVQG
jgi:hypothetical protein